MKFVDFICFEACVPDLGDADRDEVISLLVKSLDAAGKLKPGTCDKMIKAVIDRENEASTGMGKGIAVPHVKHESVDSVIAVVGQSTVGIDFTALDKQPVYSVLLLISPIATPDKHLQAMENIFKHIQVEKFRRFLRQATTQESIKDLFTEADDNPSW